MNWTAELAREIEGHVLTDENTRNSMATDFGRIIVRKPAVVVRPASSKDVARGVKFAAKHSLGVATRGGGHSQTGQSLSEHIVLDMTSPSEIRQAREEDGALVCQAGLKWRSLVEQLAARQMSPPVLTNNLDVTIGSTLSIAGLGVASWRYGTQADNCLELEVVTGTGEIIRCSPEKNHELFDAVRGGVGQFGVITEATLKIRHHRPKFRSFCLLYDDLDVLLQDLKLAMTKERFDCLES